MWTLPPALGPPGRRSGLSAGRCPSHPELTQAQRDHEVCSRLRPRGRHSQLLPWCWAPTLPTPSLATAHSQRTASLREAHAVFTPGAQLGQSQALRAALPCGQGICPRGAAPGPGISSPHLLPCLVCVCLCLRVQPAIPTVPSPARPGSHALTFSRPTSFASCLGCGHLSLRGILETLSHAKPC